jgi:5'-nucleotidase
LLVLLSNDDGVDAPGLRALQQRLAQEAEVWVVAPTEEQSAQSHSLTMSKPLRVVTRGPQWFGVTGTPADCVYVALNHVLAGRRPDIVVSGINHGSNLGSDIHYSGTVAAAREACLHGMQAIAVSLHRESEEATLHWSTAADLAARCVQQVLLNPLPRQVFLNVNVPNLLAGEVRGLKTCRLGERVYTPMVDVRVDPRGNRYLWIGGAHLHFGEGDETDGPSVERGWATVTPLTAAMTSEVDLPGVRRWTDA